MSELTAAQLVSTRRFVILRDGVPRELDYDFSALCCFEASFTMPEVEAFERLQAAYPKGIPTAELQKLRPKIGMVENSGRWAFCLTAAWREDNQEGDMTWQEFKRKLLPGPRQPQLLEAMQIAVNAMLLLEQGAESGNDDGGEAAKTSSTVSPSLSPGSDSSTPQP
jgi:hypothetical protein